jgi:hypothetical protein
LRNFGLRDLALCLACATGRRTGVWKVEGENLSLPMQILDKFISTLTATYSLESHIICFSELHPLCGLVFSFVVKEVSISFKEGKRPDVLATTTNYLMQ